MGNQIGWGGLPSRKGVESAEGCKQIVVGSSQSQVMLEWVKSKRAGSHSGTRGPGGGSVRSTEYEYKESSERANRGVDEPLSACGAV